MFIFHGQEIDYSFLKVNDNTTYKTNLNFNTNPIGDVECKNKFNQTKINTQPDTNSCILFLHGWGGNKNSFLSLAKLLNAKYNCLIVTLPTTSQTNLVWTLNDYAQCVLNLVKSLGINSVQIVCHSFGFRVATLLYHLVKTAHQKTTFNKNKNQTNQTLNLKLNANQNLAISKIVITGGAGPKKFNIFKKIEQNNNLCLLKQKKNKFLYKSIVSRDYLDLSNTNKKTFKNVVNFNTKNLLKFDIPLLLFWGKFDHETPVWIAKKIYKLNKQNAKLFVTNSNHFAYLKQSAIFANLVVNFLWYICVFILTLFMHLFVLF